MKLNLFTDIGIRALIYLTQPAHGEPFTIHRMATELNVSAHHLVKVINFMGQQGWILTFRGRNGGVKLACSPDDYRLGCIISTLEERSGASSPLINCFSPLCPLRNNCRLNPMLQGAMAAFTEHLDQYTLKDAVDNPHALSALVIIPAANI